MSIYIHLLRLPFRFFWKNLYIVSMPFRDPLRPLVLGGDHSISYSVVRAVSEKLVGPVDIYKPLEGNEYSHAGRQSGSCTVCK
ncbi:hypothetical protein PRUPE_2G076400 [Prunus persica]|uniref:Uncharacterized protein n=1 Tax=Prunus persica TaxID=3760 RepID=A0A251QG37_PRUPE|nr:hypothetical protein PRUPE_2G076400 [Prunus persica]